MDITIAAEGLVEVPTRASAIELLQGIQKALGARGRVANVFCNEQSPVPLLRLYLQEQEVVDQIDITADNRLGLANTKLIQAYIDVFAGFRALARQAKQWAKACGLEAVGRGFLGGYAWVVALMCFTGRKARREAAGEPFWAACRDGEIRRIHP